MFELRCTVRKCDHVLQPVDDGTSGLKCDAGHHFDRAKQGYWNLLQPQDRKSAKPGDSEDAVLARHRWIERGYAAPLVDELRTWMTLDSAPANSIPRTMDLGCGEGFFGPALFPDELDGYCGIDLSRKAIRLATARSRQATWVQANADRFLPAADDTVDRVISLFGRRPIDEMIRVLRPGGSAVIAVPGEEDLIELRQQVQATGVRRSRWEIIQQEMTEAGFELQKHATWKSRIVLQPDAIADALAMTYRAVRHSQQSKLESVSATDVTLAADIILFRKPSR